MTPRNLRGFVREFEIRARLEARIHSKTRLERVEPPKELCEIHQHRYMREYQQAYAAFDRTDQKEW